MAADDGVTFRPAALGIAVAAVFGVVSAIVPAGFAFLKMGLAVYFVLLLSLGWWAHVFNLFFARIRFDPLYLEMGGIFRRRIPWSRVVRWSQGEPDNDIFLELDNGKVIQLDSWCVFGERYAVAQAQLNKWVGPEATGRDRVLPWFLRLFIGD